MSTKDAFFKLENNVLTVGNKMFMKTFENIDKAYSSTDNANNLSEVFLKITAKGDEKTRSFFIWDNLPVIYIPDYREKILHTISGEHWIVKAIKLNAFTDWCDTLTQQTECHLFKMKLLPCTGDIFFLENPQDNNAIVIISEMPDYQTATMSIDNGNITIENGGNPVVLGFCKNGECEELCRNYYRHARKNSELILMSNTWGDLNRFECARQDFLVKEIDAAKEIGVDIVQMDDGWQTGSTDDLSLRDENDRKIFNETFWNLNTEKFPNGVEYVTEYGKKNNVKVGMWFAPDSHNNFSLLERDLDVLRKAYQEWGIRFFKLDMFWIIDSPQRDRFLELLQKIYSFGDDVAVQLDVTRDNRLNYLCGREYGTVFVENRYLKAKSAFPHRTLRNLWMLSRYIPSSKFQFEIINPDHFVESYSDDDPFRPCLYDMDYLFASVMVSNPLFWMELQFLSDQRREELKRIMNVWKEHQHVLAIADILPIGEKPSGRSFTGFYASVDGKPKYIVLFREVTEKDSTEISIPVECANVEVLASNADVEVGIKEGFIKASFSKPRSYVFLKIKEM